MPKLKKPSKLGRKPSLDPKVAITLYVHTSRVKGLGAKEGVRTFCYKRIEDAYIALESAKRMVEE
jgi:hypothetical protein